MIRDYRDSDEAAAFIATGDSRGTSREIMCAIVGFVDSTEEAEIMWQEGLCDWDDASAFVFVNVVTADGRDDPRGFCWGVNGSDWMREFA